MQIQASSPDEYVTKLPPERQQPVQKLRKVISENLPKGFEETISYGTIGYVVPHSIYPQGYHCNPDLPLPFMSVASQKNYIALYHSGVYADKKLEEWVKEEFQKKSVKLDMGKSCIRFKKPDEIPYDIIGKLVKKISPSAWVKLYESTLKPKK